MILVYRGGSVGFGAVFTPTSRRAHGQLEGIITSSRLTGGLTRAFVSRVRGSSRALRGINCRVTRTVLRGGTRTLLVTIYN